MTDDIEALHRDNAPFLVDDTARSALISLRFISSDHLLRRSDNPSLAYDNCHVISSHVR